MEPLGSERHGWESRRPIEWERLSHSLHRIVRSHRFNTKVCRCTKTVVSSFPNSVWERNCSGNPDASTPSPRAVHKKTGKQIFANNDIPKQILKTRKKAHASPPHPPRHSEGDRKT